MAIHYAVSSDTVACGRTGASLTSTADVAEVSCKLCLRSMEKKTAEPVRKSPSLAELRAAAKAEKAEKTAPSVSAAPAVAKPAKGQGARAEWQKRLEQLPGRNRLPRGVSRQTFI